uniref:Sperm acrosome membrane-associated protein 3 n=1 Tax=Pelusios castaneus TaxID=367368 RepID=A0A8C8SBZ2_9SAUR
MATLVLLPIFASLLVGNMGKIFRRCELAQVLHRAGLDGFRGYSLADWLCLAFHESRFDTGAVDHEADGSTDNGIFQINSRLWCDDYKSLARNLCHMHCSELVSLTLRFLFILLRLAWRKHCEGHNLSQWVAGCNVGGG